MASSELRQTPRSASTGWEAIRDVEVCRTRLEAEIDLSRLEGERVALEHRDVEVRQEIERTGETEAGVTAHERRAAGWWWLFALASGISIAGAWWSVRWFLTLTWERALLAATLFVLPLIGWTTFLTFHRVQGDDQWRLRKIFVAAGLVVILASTTAVATLGGARMLGVALQEERRGDAVAAPSSDEVRGRLEHIEETKRLLGRLAMIAVVFLSVAGEVAAGVAFHEYERHALVVRTVGRFLKERDRIVVALIDNVAAQEEARRRPEIVYAELTAAGLRQDAAERRRLGEQEQRQHSLGPTVWWVVTGFIAVLMILIAAGWAFAATDTPLVVAALLDRSSSTNAADFQLNVHALERVVLAVPAGGARLLVFTVDDKGFGSRPLFTATSPAEPGRFGEYLEAWQANTIAGWRAVASSFKPDAPASEIFGALARVSVEFSNYPKAQKWIVVLSDMRQVGQGYNFERSLDDPKATLDHAARAGLMPQLAGVKVWLLGVETEGLDERHWNNLRDFWTQYFRRTGAEIQAFMPSRSFEKR